MRVSQITVLFALVGSTAAFTNSAPRVFGVSKTCLQMADEEAVMEEVARPTSGLSIKAVHRMMKNVSAATFDETAKTIEPFLVNDAGATMLQNTKSRLSAKAKLFGKTLPEGYAAGAVAAAKRSAKQDAFIAKKIEEIAAAAAAAAEAAEAEAAAAIEAAAAAAAAAEAEAAAAIEAAAAAAAAPAEAVAEAEPAAE